MTKKQMIEEIRRVVVMACHPGKTQKEAFEIEERLCLDMGLPFVRQWHKGINYYLAKNFTIGRVMAGMEQKGFYQNNNGWWHEYGAPEPDKISNPFINWQLLKEDGSETTLEDQAEETIDKLYSLICK